MDDRATGRNEPAPDDDAGSQRTGWVDEKVLAASEPSLALPASNGSTPAGHDNGRAIDALRAATTAAGESSTQPTIDDIAQIRRLHQMRVDAEHRVRRALLKPGARRKFQYALTAETAALRMVGFGSFGAFTAVYGAVTSADNSAAESAETIARIQELLTELGVDPHGDPLRAASEFLTTHESSTSEREAVAAATPVVEHLDITDDAVRASATTDEINAREAPSPPTPIAPVAPVDTSVHTTDTEEPALDGLAGIELEPDASPIESEAPAVDTEPVPDENEAAPEIQSDPTGAESTLDLEPEAPWVPAAQLPPANPNEIRKNDDDVLDRWIHAEARAERMHAEVDRAQAELVAMLARSADLERTVVTRADELDTANADLEAANRELERVRERAEELERSIVRSDTQRDDLETALTTSRDRVTDLEATLQEREVAYTEAGRERAAALESAADLEMTLAARTSELEAARASVTDLETQLSTQAARLDRTSGELGAARTSAEELTTELETTRRALDALDSHAEAIEAELADARRAADSTETRHELESVRRELGEARRELGHLEYQRAETDRSLAQDRIELQQLQHTLATTRDQAIVVLDELTAARRTVEESTTQAEEAERARAAITIDAADLLARAEAEATSMLERANRDAEAIRQEATLAGGVGLRADDYGRSGGEGASNGSDTLAHIIERIERLERKLAKQRRRLDRMSKAGRAGTDAPHASTPEPKSSTQSAVEELTRLVSIAGGSELEPAVKTRGGAAPDLDAAGVIAAAEREAEDIRRVARREREQFRTELVALLSRLAPLTDEIAVDQEDDDDEDDDW